MAEPPTPENLAFLICDSIIDDRKTGKKTLVGIFNRIGTSAFPCTHPDMAVFVSLTDGRGTYKAELNCLCSDTQEPIMHGEGQVAFKDPNSVVEIGFHLRGLTFPKAGMYEFEFLCNGVRVAERRFEVRETANEP